MAPRGRTADLGGHWSMAPSSRQLALTALLPLLLACGGIVDPDLTTGEVTGALTNAQPGAYAYALGAPSTKAPVVNGTFRLQHVPVGTVQVVLYDGGPPGVGKAEALEVQVKGASRVAAAARDASDMPLAGSIVPVPRCGGGGSGTGVHFTVDGTDLEDVVLDAGTALYPLAAGQYKLHGSLAGYVSASQDVKVEPGAEAPEELELDVDDSLKDRGCLAGSGCDEGLTCQSDGRCCTASGCSQSLQEFWSECVVGSTSCASALGTSGFCYATSGLAGRCTVGCATDPNICPSSRGMICDPAAQVCVKPSK
jgi:hypothetical protein